MHRSEFLKLGPLAIFMAALPGVTSEEPEDMEMDLGVDMAASETDRHVTIYIHPHGTRVSERHLQEAVERSHLVRRIQ